MLGRLLTGRLLFVGERSLRVDAIMLQWLLAERFKLALDREERALPGHALVVGKSGLNGKPSEPERPVPDGHLNERRNVATVNAGAIHPSVQ